MTTRTTSKDVVFLRPFILDGMTDLQAAGTYRVDTEEEQLDTLSIPAWRRIRTVLRVVRAGGIDYLPIDPDQLHEALMRDGAQPDPAAPIGSVGPKLRRDRARAMRHSPRKPL